MEGEIKLLDIYKVLNLLGEPTRLRIVNVIHRGALNVTEIKDSVQISQANCSKHLKVMYDHGILKRHKINKTVYYYVNPNYRNQCKVLQPILTAFSGHEDSINDLERVTQIVHEDPFVREKTILDGAE